MPALIFTGRGPPLGNLPSQMVRDAMGNEPLPQEGWFRVIISGAFASYGALPPAVRRFQATTPSWSLRQWGPAPSRIH